LKIAILIEDHYQILEAWYPYLRLQEEGIEPVFVGTGQLAYKSKERYPLQEEVSIMDISADEFDGIIIPGGNAPDILRHYSKVNELVKDMFDHGKLVAAICHGGLVLASAGIITNQKMTCYPGIKDELILAGADYLDLPVVVTVNLITSRNVSDLPMFCKEIVRFLKKDAFNGNGVIDHHLRINRDLPLFAYKHDVSTFWIQS
jgi:protease I